MRYFVTIYCGYSSLLCFHRILILSGGISHNVPCIYRVKERWRGLVLVGMVEFLALPSHYITVSQYVISRDLPLSLLNRYGKSCTS